MRNKCAMTCFGKKVLSLGRHKFEPVQHSEPCETACRMAESKRSSETSYACERGLSHELINFEPSPEFLSSSQLTKKSPSIHFSLKSTDARHLAYISIVDKYSTDLLEINSAFNFLFLRSFLGNSIGVTIPQFEFIG